jgi:hypothetical protein
MPDGSSKTVYENQTVDAALLEAIKKYPHIFYVSDKSKCGSLQYYEPIYINNGSYACGYVAFTEHSPSTNLKTQGNKLGSTDLTSATVYGLVSVIVGFYISYVFTKKAIQKASTKTQKALRLIFTISIGIGISGVINELLFYFILDYAIRQDKISMYLIANVLIFPLIAFFGFKLALKFQTTIPIDTAVNTTTISPQATNSKVINEKITIAKDNLEISETHWESALNEYQSENRKNGLWAKLYSENNGNENLVKAAYIKKRATELSKLAFNPSSIESDFEINKNLSSSFCLNNNKFKEVRSTKYLRLLKLMNGSYAVEYGSIYKIYQDELFATNAVNTFERTEVFPTVGFIENIQGQNN